MGNTRILVALAVSLLGVARTRADDVNAAREHFKRGSKLYDLQRFEEAAEAYEKAYEAKDDPALLFNIAQAYRFAQKYEKAIGAYRAFLRRQPGASNRADVLARIDEMQKLLEAQRRSSQQPPGGTLPPAGGNEPGEPKPVEPKPAGDNPPSTLPPQVAPDRTAPRMKVAGHVTGALGLALVVTGGALLGVAASAAGDVNNAPDGTPFDASKEEQVRTLVPAGAALTALGAAAAIAGTTVAVLGYERARPRNLSLVPALGPGGAGLVFGGRF